MGLLLTGIVLFCVVHLFPSLMPAARDRLVSRLGENPYKAVFSVLILAGLILIVLGWKAAVPRPVYIPPMAPGLLPSALVFAGLVLFLAAQMRGYLKRVLRHPQMIGTVLWAVSHLLTNGDSRSVLLFGSLLIWALLEILLCNRRDGPRQELPAAAG
ncbi:MAG: NnrU family protein, partial [Woeseiaceae bacterium]